MQSAAYQSGRGFVAGADYDCTVGAFCRRNFWHGRTVRYFFDNSLTSDDQRWMTNQMTLIRNTTGMRFRKVSNTGWVRFWHSLSLSDDLKISKQNLPSNLHGRATVGRVGSSILQMNTDHVQEKSVFHHEMGHVFGLLHEHQRYDRNTYVRASRRGSDYNVIRRRNCYWFAFWSWCSTNSSTYSTPYDYHSIMHYDHGFVAVSTNRSWTPINGDTFTSWDVYMIKRLYGITSNPRPRTTPTP